MKTITIIILVVFISIFVIPAKLHSNDGAWGSGPSGDELLIGLIVIVALGVLIYLVGSSESGCLFEGNRSLSCQAEKKTVNDFDYQEYQADLSRGNNKSMTVLSLSF